LGDLGAYCGVDDRVQVGQGPRVVEHHIGHSLAVERPVRGNDLGSEPLDHRVEDRLAGLLQGTGDGIGIDDHRTERREASRNRALS
jgi:hypothetical protein